MQSAHPRSKYVKNLIRLARVTFELIEQESNKERLEECATLTLSVKILIDEEDRQFHSFDSDVSQNLLEFAQLKADGNAAAQDYSQYVREDIEALEEQFGL